MCQKHTMFVLQKRNNGVIMVTFVDKFVRCSEDYSKANISDVIGKY